MCSEKTLDGAGKGDFSCAYFFEILNCNQENGNIIISILFLLLCLCRPFLQGVESGCGTRIEISRLTAQIGMYCGGGAWKKEKVVQSCVIGNVPEKIGDVL